MLLNGEPRANPTSPPAKGGRAQARHYTRGPRHEPPSSFTPASSGAIHRKPGHVVRPRDVTSEKRARRVTIPSGGKGKKCTCPSPPSGSGRLVFVRSDRVVCSSSKLAAQTKGGRTKQKKDTEAHSARARASEGFLQKGFQADFTKAPPHERETHLPSSPPQYQGAGVGQGTRMW